MATYLLDANILLRLAHREDPAHTLTRQAVVTLARRGDPLFLVAQTLYEAWVVATRPAAARGGMGLTPPQADRLLRRALRVYPLLPDPPDLFARWHALVAGAGVSGLPSHDARLVAAMEAHGLTHILTFNTADFARYAARGITGVNPADV